MTQWVKLENCPRAFGEEKYLKWLSKFGKPLIPIPIPQFLPMMGRKVQVY